MSSEFQKYTESTFKKEQNLLNAEVISFPSDNKIVNSKNMSLNTLKFWKINDKSNEDQFRAIIGICFIFAALFLVGLYSSLS